ncbi:L-serine ammonia-lyase, iron-sulfur-dependent, subunit alpha [[Clostridium] innocuum]|nr:L-serine ammonia-lyase, iron-sulfur-dependent, subunit alpha [[Clostridium] innocuum]
MKSLKELYRIGPGPSSSHTLGPQRAASLFKERYPMAHHFEVELFGSLALTGKGHLTDYIIIKTMKPKDCVVLFKNRRDLKHPNTMHLMAMDEQHKLLGEWTVYSIGGGAIQIEGEESKEGADVYPHHSMKEIEAYCEAHSMELWEYVNHFDPLDDYMDTIMNQMMATVDGGLEKEGVLPGDLKLKRIARELKEKADVCRSAAEQEKLLLCAYAYSASEENASGSTTVTAPTLGSSGILPALVCYYHRILGYSREQLRNGLKVAGLFGNLIKENATISGAQGGCQAEIGAAVAMGAAMAAYLRGQTTRQIEYAAEIGIEHHLGLTCDPVGGYVMIPCIERNAVGVLRSIDAAILAEGISDLRKHKVSFDMVVNTMNYTGRKIPIELRETSLGGLASVVPLK